MKTTIKVGSDFSGVGAFNQALTRLGINYQEVFACDMDKYARQTFIHNYGEPEYYPMNVYDREIPKESLDIYMTSPPCQAFSMAGKRLGKEDERGILFFNSLEFIRVNNPRFFIFENVKGLLSHDKENKKNKIGRTFQEWIDYLGGKSVNGITTMMPIDGSVPYHLHYKVLNAKKHGVPQNRERVFLIGIRDDQDNIFTWPQEEELTKRLKDVLDNEVDDKYFLSHERIGTITKAERGIGWTDADKKDSANCIISGYHKHPTDGEYIKVNSATSKGYEEATEGDSINFSVPNSQTRRGRVGKGVAQTLDTACNQGVMIGAFRGRNPNNASDRTTGAPTEQRLEINQQGTSNTITTVQKDNVVVDNYKIRRLTPRECFRLMDFPDTFTWPVSDSQAYKQAGNSIVVRVLEKIINNLPL
jgi:DNA (cytosine-5)-methyltransferase 1